MECLNEFDQIRQLAADPNAVELALWYHDAYYNTTYKENEEKSAELFQQIAEYGNLNDSLIRKVFRMILETRHTIQPIDPDSQLVVDIDLSVLGWSKDRFDEYERQIRVEYAWVPQDMFASVRSEILASFLGRQHMYATQFFREKYEAQARRNIARSLAQLLCRS